MNKFEYPFTIAAKLLQGKPCSQDEITDYIVRTRNISDELYKLQEQLYQANKQLDISEQTVRLLNETYSNISNNKSTENSNTD